MLALMVRWFDLVVLGTVAIPSNDICYVAIPIYVSHNIGICLFASAIFYWCLHGCVCIRATIAGTHLFINASATCVLLVVDGTRIHNLRDMFCSFNRDSVVHAVFVD